MKKKGASGAGQYVVLSALTTFAFIVIYFMFFKVDYHNTGGAYMAVSASTIKFVNQWLEEGPANLHFTCYEYFDSVEFSSLSERCPYISYPVGSTFLIWGMARLMGRNHIGISFLKHVQALFFLTETLSLAFFSCFILTQRGCKGKTGRIMASVLIAVTWMYLPGNAWYLSNVLWSDQLVILYVMLFIMLEYMNDILNKSRLKLFIKAIRTGIIYMGVMTDYFFWIFIFCVTLIKAVRFILIRMDFRTATAGLCEYVWPVFAGIATFLWQISYTENWFSVLKKKFIYRTGGTAEGSLFDNFCSVFTAGSTVRGGCCWLSFFSLCFFQS